MSNDELKIDISNLAGCSFHSIKLRDKDNFSEYITEDILLGIAVSMIQLGQVEYCGRIIFENNLETRLIEKKELISKSTSKQEKADLLINIAEVHRDMKEEKLAIEKYNESIAVFPENYGATLALLEIQFTTKKRKELTNTFFNLDPGNPEICDDIARVYFQNDDSKLVIDFFNEKLKEYIDN